MINIKYDDKKVSDEKVTELSNSIIKIVSESTGIADVFVYADSPKIKIGVAPIEIFIQAGVSVINDKEKLLSEIKDKLSDWKKENNFETPINLTVMPMDWKFEVNI